MGVWNLDGRMVSHKVILLNSIETDDRCQPVEMNEWWYSLRRSDQAVPSVLYQQRTHCRGGRNAEDVKGMAPKLWRRRTTTNNRPLILTS